MKEFRELIGYYLMLVHEKGLEIVPVICNISVARYVLLTEYKRLRLDISELEEKDKVEMWEFVNKHFPNESKQFKIDTCKIISTIGSLVQ